MLTPAPVVHGGDHDPGDAVLRARARGLAGGADHPGVDEAHPLEAGVVVQEAHHAVAQVRCAQGLAGDVDRLLVRAHDRATRSANPRSAAISRRSSSRQTSTTTEAPKTSAMAKTPRPVTTSASGSTPPRRRRPRSRASRSRRIISWRGDSLLAEVIEPVGVEGQEADDREDDAIPEDDVQRAAAFPARAPGAAQWRASTARTGAPPSTDQRHHRRATPSNDRISRIILRAPLLLVVLAVSALEMRAPLKTAPMSFSGPSAAGPSRCLSLALSRPHHQHHAVRAGGERAGARQERHGRRIDDHHLVGRAGLGQHLGHAAARTSRRRPCPRPRRSARRGCCPRAMTTASARAPRAAR